MAIVGTAYIAVRTTSEGLEATLVKDVKSAAAAAEAGSKIVPVVDTSKATGPLDLLKSKITGFAGASNPLTKALGDVETASGGAEGALAGLSTGGIAIAGAAAVAFAVKSVAAFQDYAGAAVKVQRVTGATAEDSSKLAAAFRAVGISPDQAAPSLGRFARNIATNGEALGKLGIEITKNKDGTTNMAQSFLNVADAVSRSKDPTEQLNIAMTAFGRQGQTLLPILQRGREGITELFGEAGKHGQLFSQKDLDTSKELSMAFRQVKEVVEGVFVAAGKVIAPFVLNIINIGQGIGELATKFTVVKDIIKVALAVAFAPLIGIVKAVDLLSKAVDWLTGKHHDHKAASKDDAAATDDLSDSTTGLAGAADAAAKAIDAQKKAEDDHKKAVSDLQSAIESVTTAQRDLKDANKGVTDANDRLADSRKKLSDLEKAGIIDTNAVAQATKDLASAQKAAEDAVLKVADATKSVADATQNRLDALGKQAIAQQRVNDLISGQAAAEDMLAHRHDLEHATLAVRNAQSSLNDALKAKAEVTNRVAAAEQKLADMRAGHTATATDIAKAQQDVQDAQTSQADDLATAQLKVDEATLSLTESQESLTDTQKTLNDLQHEGETGSKTLAAAQKDLSGANRDVANASDGLAKAQRDLRQTSVDLTVSQQDVITKQAELNKALQPDPKLQEAILSARKDVKTATQGVADASFSASQKAGDLGRAQGILNTSMGNSLGNLRNVKDNLQAIVNLQPQAQSALQPTIDMINQLITATLGVVLPGGGKIKSTPQGDVYYSPSGGRVLAYAGGGFANNDFVAGEHGPELISLRGGGAMVYSAHTPESRQGDTGGLAINIEAHFGPGTNADDVIGAMRSIAQNEIAGALAQVSSKINAGARR